jgi:hypothetical protein
MENNLWARFIYHVLIILIIALTACRVKDKDKEDGLIGIYFSEPNLTSVKGITILETLEQVWDDRTEFITGSSGDWKGYIEGPVNDVVSFKIETNKRIVLKIGDEFHAECNKQNPVDTLLLDMQKNERYPIQVIFYNGGTFGDYGSFKISWQWSEQPFTSIPISALSHSQFQVDDLKWILDSSEIDRSRFVRAQARHVIVYYEKDRFGGWPANNGIWQWGDEILVGFLKAYYKENQYHHSLDQLKPMQSVLARSLDGGETWSIEDPDNFVGDGNKAQDLSEALDFQKPGLAMRCSGQGLFVSNDKGKQWQGPFFYNGLNVGEITARTDYLVNGKNDCFFFLSAKDTSVSATLQDRAFCARTIDGGISFQFVSWMAETDTIRSVMPATVRISERHLVTVMRRRYDCFDYSQKRLAQNYITAHQSLDNGKTWSFLSKVAETDRGLRNGNPPSMIRLTDGRLCVTYGYRSNPYSIRARLSDDAGKTWGKEIILRDDAHKFDIGYTRTVQRKDGKILTIYYYTNKTYPEPHIEATIWDSHVFSAY